MLPALSEIQGAEQAARQHGDELAQTLQKVQELQGQLTHLSRKADRAFTSSWQSRARCNCCRGR